MAFLKKRKMKEHVYTHSTRLVKCQNHMVIIKAIYFHINHPQVIHIFEIFHNKILLFSIHIFRQHPSSWYVVLSIFIFFYHNFKHTKGSANIYKPNKKILVILTTYINTNTLRKQKSLSQRIVRQTIKKGSIMTVY